MTRRILWDDNAAWDAGDGVADAGPAPVAFLPAFTTKGDYNWAGGAGAFGDGADWINAVTGKTGHVPGPSDLAAIQSDATISGNGTVGELYIEGPTRATFTGAIKTRGLFLDDDSTLTLATAKGGLSVTVMNFTLNEGATVVVTGGATLKGKGINFESRPNEASTLIVSAGGKVTCSYMSSDDFIDVTGAGSTITTGSFSPTSLTLGAGARVVSTGLGYIQAGTIADAAFSAKSGLTIETLTVSAKGTVTTGGELTAEGSSSTLVVESGAKATAASADISDTARVSGTGSLISVKGLATIGDAAPTLLVIEGGAHFQAGSAHIGGAQDRVVVTGVGSGAVVTALLDVGWSGKGTLLVESGGAVRAGRLLLGDKANNPKSTPVGVLTVADATLLVTGAATIGVSGSGRLTVSGGGRATIDGLCEAGAEADGTGTVVVTGTRSRLAYKGALVVGGRGTATLDVEAGGAVAALAGGSGTIEVAADTGARGTLAVEGANSTLSGTQLVVGGTTTAAGGAGTLAIDGRSKVAVKTVEVWGHGAASLGGGSLTARSVTIKAGGAVTGDGTVTAAIVNAGTIEAMGGTLDVKGAISGAGGALEIGAGGTIELSGAVAATQKVTFAAKGTLDLADPAAFKAAISGFAHGDALDLAGFATAKAGFKENAKKTEGTLTITDGAKRLSVVLLGNFAAAGFKVATDHHGGGIVTYTPPPSPTALLALAGH